MKRATSGVVIGLLERGTARIEDSIGERRSPSGFTGTKRGYSCDRVKLYRRQTDKAGTRGIRECRGGERRKDKTKRENEK